MLDFTDLPYQWFEPRRSPLIARLVRFVNRVRHLPRTKRIVEVRVEGGHELASLVARHPVVLVLNHPTHADAAIALEAARRVQVWPIFMAAYDVFLRSRLDAYVMTRLGAFSVDREGSDSRAMKCAAAVLAAPGRALTIFPEGNVYLENDRATPFHDGPAFMALRAQKEAGNQPIYTVPVSIKTTHLTDIRPQLKQRIVRLAAAVEADITAAATPLDALRCIGVVALRRNLTLRGLEAFECEELRPMIEQAADAVLTALEKKLRVETKPGEPLIDRVRKCRRLIHEVRTAPARVADHAAAATWADEAMLAFRIVSYSGAYVAEKPTVDRLAETTEKLIEDVERRMIAPFGDRRALVRFSDPIDLRPYLAGDAKLRVAVRSLTADLESAVQRGLDALNAANNAAGAELWESW